METVSEHPLFEHPVSAMACQDLWRAVIVATYRCAYRPSHWDWRDQRACLDWFGSPDFRTVCSLAGLDAERIEARIQQGVFPFDQAAQRAAEDRVQTLRRAERAYAAKQYARRRSAA